MTINIINDSPESLIEDFKNKKVLVFSKDEVIFFENNPAFGVHFIKEGKVKIIKSCPGKENKILNFASRGDFLGLHSVISGNNYSNSAIAIEKTETCFIEKEEFFKKINRDINKKLLVMRLLCDKIGNMENQMSSISEKSAAGRLAESLLFLLEAFGSTKDNFLNIRLTVEDLANLTGTSKGYLLKIISEFNHNRWIYTARNKVKILDKNKLREISS